MEISSPQGAIECSIDSRLNQIMKPKAIHKPRAIVKGETIGVIALAAPSEGARFSRGVAALESQGFKVKVALNPSAAYGTNTHMFASDTPKARADALHALFLDKEVGAIIAVRGGYGSLEVLPHIDFKILKKHPKFLVGFSDITTFVITTYLKGGLVTVHGPTIESAFSKSSENKSAAKSGGALLEFISGWSRTPLGDARLETVLGEQEAIGPLIGGNLAVIASMMGTPWEPDFSEHILFFEEIGEQPYRIHRILMQLKIAGKFKNIKGVIVGSMHNCIHPKGSGPTVRDVLVDIFREYEIPVLIGAPFGHEELNLPMPLGVRARIATTKGERKLELLESAVLE